MESFPLVKGLKDQIADRLRREILSGRLAAGTPLRETQLSAQFAVSRGPVREALQTLTYEGLLIAERNRGVRVAPPAPDSIREFVIPIRRTIEIYALRLFFSELNANDFDVWNDILAELKRVCQRRDYLAIAEQDIALHRSFLKRAGQPDLLAIWSVLVARVRHHFWKGHRNYSNPMEIYAEHRELIDIFQRGDLEAAVKALEENIE